MNVAKKPATKAVGSNITDALPLVIVVDDDADVRASLTDMFLSIGTESVTYGSTAELMAAGVPERPTCLILDLRMPGASGLELQAQLAKQGIRVPIIFLTGYADVPTSVRAMKAGAVDFMAKPFREQELLDAVAEALRRDIDRRREDEEVNGIRLLAIQLTPRERDVLEGVRRGLLNKQIAFELGISEITVKMHRSSAGRKLKSVSVADMVRKVELIRS
ncbi:response regulator [Methylobacterium sp. Leaf86]|uniref:response regulator transcription factor n=1 Tax=Methylobacterium sp. Leaf86 TaxID=1736242 RepID=UPI0009E8A0EA|nr:response regulator [Methylobacterium sp. Leaf86]